MQRTRYDGSDARRVLIAMATNAAVLSRIAQKWPSPGGLFDSSWSNLVGNWCVSHHRKFGTPPNGKLTHKFEQWTQQHTAEQAVVDAVERFLQGLSDQAEHTPDEDVEYLVHLAERVFNEARLRQTVQQVQVELDYGRVEEAQHEYERHRRIDFGEESFEESLSDFIQYDAHFQVERRRPLVTYPDDAGKFISDAFVRGEFYAFMGPDKTGKTSYLVDLCYRALRRRNRVVYFDSGDGDASEFHLRLACRATGRAETAMKTQQYPCGFDKDGKLITDERDLKAFASIESFMSLNKITKSSDALRVECFPNSTVSISDIDSRLSQWAEAGWAADVVVIDYADILAPPAGIDDPLEQIDETWKAMRRMSQDKHCLVVTATQSSAAAYGREQGLLSRKHFSGRKTKLAHVNGMIGINVSDDERKLQMARLNWVVRRKGRNRQRGFVTVAGCFDVHNPIVISRW